MQTVSAYFENSCVQTFADWLKAIIDTTAAKLILMFFFAFWVTLQIHQSKKLFRALPLHRKFTPKQKASSNTERFQEIEDLKNHQTNLTIQQRVSPIVQLQVCQKNDDDDIHDPSRIQHIHIPVMVFPLVCPNISLKTSKKTFLTYRRIPRIQNDSRMQNLSHLLIPCHLVCIPTLPSWSRFWNFPGFRYIISFSIIFPTSFSRGTLGHPKIQVNEVRGWVWWTQKNRSPHTQKNDRSVR